MSEGNLKQILTLGNSIIGVSILAMPYCLKQCGLVLGIILLIISGYINRINCHFLIKSAISTKRRSYEFLAFHIFGPMGKFAIEVIQIGFLFGICVSFFVIAGDLGPKILAQVLDIEYTDRFRAFFLGGLCFFIVLPLSLLRNTDSLASISAISITFYVLLVLKIVSDSWRHILAGSWQAEVELWRPAGVLQALPIMSLALACQTNVFSIYESLPDPSLSRMNTVVAGAINLCSSVYILVGFFGYVAFHDVPFGGNILVQLLPSPVTRWINIGFVMSIALGFPLVVYPCRVSVNSLLFRRPGSSLELPQNHIPELRFKCITFCILITAMCIGIIIPSIEVVLGLLGSTMGTAIAILFPSVMFIKNTSRNNLEKMAAQMSFILGIVLLVCGTYMNLYAVDQLAQEPAAIPPVPAVTAPPAVSSPAAAPAPAAGGPALSNVTDKKDLVPDKPPGDTDGDGRQAEEKSKKTAPEGEARKEPAIPEPPPEKKPADKDAENTAKDGDTEADDEKKAAAKKRKTSGEERDGGGDAAVPGGAGGDKKKSSGRKSKHRDSKKKDDGAADAAEDAEAEADAGDAAGSAGDAEKRAADAGPAVGAGGGEALDMGALRKEEEERERDNALRPEDPQAKELELKQEEVLQKLEETHKEQKELLQEQKALLKEMKQQRSEQEIEALKRANQEAALGGAGVQQQQQPAMVQQQQQQQPGMVQQQQPGMVQQQQPGIVQQQQPGIVQQQQQQPGMVQQQPGMVQQLQPGIVQQQQPGIVQQQQQQQPGIVQQQQPEMVQQQQQPGMVQQQQQPGMVQQQQPGMVQQQQQQQPGMVQQQQQPGLAQQQQQPGLIQQQPVILQQQQQPGIIQQQPAGQVPALGQGQQQQFVPNQPLTQKQVQQQQQQPAVNQVRPDVNMAPLQGKQPAPIPMAAAAAGAASKRERAPAQQKTADADTAQKKHNKHASHGRVRREVTGSAEDEMLVRLAENWAAMEAGGAAARATAKRR